MNGVHQGTLEDDELCLYGTAASGRLVLHCDLDSFFASVEQVARPELMGLPVAISAARGQAVITAASYEAKRKGVKVGVPLKKARELCPNLNFLPARMESYQRAGAFVHDIIRSTGAPIETLGIDECFLRLDQVDRERITLPEYPAGLPLDPLEYAAAVATWIKREVAQRTGLWITIGAGSNKTIAKLATDAAKPDGLLIVRPEQERAFLHDTPIGNVAGIGPRSVMKLHASEIRTVGEIARLSPGSAISMLGKHQGRVIHAMSRNLWDESVIPNPKPKSTSATRSFGSQGHNALDALEDLLGEVLLRLSQTGRSARQVGVFAADPSSVYQAKHDLRAPTADLKEIAATARALMRRIPQNYVANIAGVTLDGLSDSEQLRLGFEVGWVEDPELSAPVVARPYDSADQLRRNAFRGMPVQHPTFGSGIVSELAGHTVTVRFDDRERVLDYSAPLKY